MRKKLTAVLGFVLLCGGTATANTPDNFTPQSRYFKGYMSQVREFYKHAYGKHGKKKLFKTPLEIGNTLKKPVALLGVMTLGDVLSVLAEQGIQIKSKGNVPLDKKVVLSLKTNKVNEIVDTVCSAADVWCDYDPITRTLNITDKKVFTFDFFPEGQVLVSIGGTGGGGESGGSDSGSGEESGGGGATGGSASFVYQFQNIDRNSFLEMLGDSLGKTVKALASSNFITVSLSPSEWQFLNSYFNQRRTRRQVVDVEITLLRVDLKKQFQWGIDWNALMYRTDRALHSVKFGFQSGTQIQISQGEAGSFVQFATNSNSQAALISALSQFGKVYKVDSWHTQGLTGAVIPFGNYQDIKYFTIGSTSTDSGTETTAEDKTVEVGFLGSLVVYNNVDGYYVDGAINLSSIMDWITLQLDKGELKAPEIEGKKFRIATRLNNLNTTLVVGGFRTHGFTSSESAIPLLHKIPVLGWLFKGKKNLKQDSEFVVLITLKKGREGLPEPIKANLDKAKNSTLYQ